MSKVKNICSAALKYLCKDVAYLSLIFSMFFAGTATAYQSAKPYTDAFRYNVHGQITGKISPDPDGAGPLRYSAIRNSYAANGQLVSVENGELYEWLNESYEPKNWTGFTVFNSTIYTYDAQGRMVSEAVKDNFGQTQSYKQMSYDLYDRLECSVIRFNKSLFDSLSKNACISTVNSEGDVDRVTKYTYDSIGQIYVVYKAFGTPLQQAYKTNEYYDGDKAGLIKSVQDANNNKTSYFYDGTPGLLTKTIYPDRSVELFEYDLHKNVKKKIKRNGAVINYSYDARQRLIMTDYDDNSKIKDVYHKYDLRGLVLESRSGSYDDTKWIINSFNGFGDLVTTVTAQGYYPTINKREIHHEYDQNSNRVRITHPDRSYFVYEYDGVNKLKSIHENGAELLVSLNYSNQGYVQSHVRGNTSSTNYTMDKIGRLVSLSQDLDGRSNDVTENFGYNSASQMLTIESSNHIYSHDSNDLVVGSYSVNNLNQYTSAGGRTISHDPNGNLISDSYNTYTYDNENRLITVSGQDNALLDYDPLGRLYSITVQGQKNYFLYDGDYLIAEYNSAGDVIKRYVHDAGIDQPLVQYKNGVINANNRQYLHANYQGSIIALTNTDKTLAHINTYDAFGIPKSSNQGRFGYTGQLYLHEVGLNYYKARIYNPRIGRFMQTDPIGYEDDMNWYAYVGNDPINHIDPTGEAKYKGDKSGIAAANLAARAVVAVTEKGSPINNAAQSVADTTQKMITDGSITSRGARREVMRQQNIPTSQQPSSQSKNASGKEFTYDVSKKGGGTEQKSVQQQTMDSSHPGEKHWEAGSVKTDPVTGETRMTKHGRPKLTNEKSKVDYNE